MSTIANGTTVWEDFVKNWAKRERRATYYNTFFHIYSDSRECEWEICGYEKKIVLACVAIASLLLFFSRNVFHMRRRIWEITSSWGIAFFKNFLTTNLSLSLSLFFQNIWKDSIRIFFWFAEEETCCEATPERTGSREKGKEKLASIIATLWVRVS